ncbi:G protein-activated inward rectifier potassium channel 3-like isoform X2 [Zootermopsis nevadensis]|uniref:G protein-activated inward rectifier potassium channel 3-like isoform X2 n=1 Tax=Zootermopsis nevadensis TaxID=136037 RepID=UPI000B8E2A7F|nr:G protein-activated inward rectifier potassium channel 3-like isoform X2 [Zootermopsis nevadensis]
MKVFHMIGRDEDEYGAPRAPTAVPEDDEVDDDDDNDELSFYCCDNLGKGASQSSGAIIPDAAAEATGSLLRAAGGGGGGGRDVLKTPYTLIRVSTYTSSLNQPTIRSRYRNGGTGRSKMRRRVVLKSGECNVLQSRVAQRRLRYLQDIFTTLVDIKWRWTLLVFALSFILSWLGFALLWWLIAFTHGDFELEHLPHQQEESGWKPCIKEVYSFASCFLFSIETQHTIGYGSRSTTEECPEAVFVMCLQSITGVMIQAFMVGIVFAKMARPKQRAQTLLFSRNAVVCLRDGELCLMFRVGDMRKSHIIGATIRAQLIRTRTTKEGEVLHQHQTELNIGTDGGDNNLFFIWPMTVVHRINCESPLYNISASDIIDRESRFEVVVILEGTIESTGQTTQARSSYLPNEVLWGHRFQPMLVYNKERQGYEVDYSRFNNTDLVDTPLCSARDLEHFYQLQQDLEQSASPNPAESSDGQHGMGLRRVTSEPNAMSNMVTSEEPNLMSM